MPQSPSSYLIHIPSATFSSKSIPDTNFGSLVYFGTNGTSVTTGAYEHREAPNGFQNVLILAQNHPFSGGPLKGDSAVPVLELQAQ